MTGKRSHPRMISLYPSPHYSALIEGERLTKIDMKKSEHAMSIIEAHFDAMDEKDRRKLIDVYLKSLKNPNKI